MARRASVFVRQITGLNRLTTMFLDFAEDRAQRRQTTPMTEWVAPEWAGQQVVGLVEGTMRSDPRGRRQRPTGSPAAPDTLPSARSLQ
ncbi:MAG: hypothetical protein ACRDST_03000 [Pseudonocardiaceae bacterium]